MKVLVSNPQIELAEKLFSSDEQVVVHLVLKAGQEVDRHHSPMTVVVVPIKGRVLFAGEDSEEEIIPGHVVRLNPSEPHNLKALEDSELIVIKSELK